MQWVGVATSTAVHLLVVAWITERTPAPAPIVAPSEPMTVEIVEASPPKPPEPEVAPIEVAFLDEATEAALPETAVPAPAAIPRPSRDTGNESTPPPQLTLPGAGPGSAVETAPIDPAKRSILMSMRRPRVDLRIGSTDYGSAVDNAPAGTGPENDATTGQLHPAGGGTYRSDQGPFTARIERDGEVKLKDKKNFHIHLAIPSLKDLGRGFADWYHQEDKTPQDPDQVALNGHRPSDTDTRPDHGNTVPLLGGGFDISDALMRDHGQDPYASQKLKFLDSTRDERVQIGNRHRQQQLQQATQIMQRNLDRVWASVTDARARKQALFELWDECAETGTEDLIAAGADARRLVIGFIRARLPAGRADAFTADEISAFNRVKQSKAAFAPYD